MKASLIMLMTVFLFSLIACKTLSPVQTNDELNEPKELKGAVCIRISLPLQKSKRYHLLKTGYLYQHIGDNLRLLVTTQVLVGDRFYFFDLIPGRYSVAGFKFEEKNKEHIIPGFFLLTRRASDKATFEVHAGVLEYPGVFSGKLSPYGNKDADEFAKHTLSIFFQNEEHNSFSMREYSKTRSLLLTNGILFYPYLDETSQLIQKDLVKFPSQRGKYTYKGVVN